MMMTRYMDNVGHIAWGEEHKSTHDAGSPLPQQSAEASSSARCSQGTRSYHLAPRWWWRRWRRRRDWYCGDRERGRRETSIRHRASSFRTAPWWCTCTSRATKQPPIKEWQIDKVRIMFAAPHKKTACTAQLGGDRWFVTRGQQQ